MNRLALTLLIILSLSAGCSTLDGRTTGGENPSTSNPTTPTVSPEIPSSTTDANSVPREAAQFSAKVSCDRDLQLELWRTYDTDLWTRGSIHVFYYAPSNSSIFLVTYIDGEVAGSVYQSNTDNNGIYYDGLQLELDTTFSDEHTVQIAVHRDENGNEQFESDIDRACVNNSSIVQAGPETLNFSQY